VIPPPFAGKSVAITGGAGYLGSHLARRLAPANRVRILDLVPPRDPSGEEFMRCDITDAAQCLAALEGAQVVFHRAGLFGNLPSMREPVRYHAINVAGTLNVLEACAAHSVERLVFDSTAFVYGNELVSPAAESARARPVSIYGAAKLAAEALVFLYDRQRGVPSVVLRFCRVRDAAKADVISVLARRIRDGLALELFEEGSPALDFVDVGDATEAAVLAAASDLRETVINVSCGTMMPLVQIAELLALELGRPLVQVRSLQPVRQPPSAEYLFGPRQFHLDARRAADLLGWRPRKDIPSMVRETAAAIAAELPAAMP
jgi:UDP-glucose 4-epimerase